MHFLNVPRSKSSSIEAECDTYAPLSDALNIGLERLSKIEVDGLPKFQDRVVFVPSGDGVTSNHDLAGSLFKPDVVFMPFTTTCGFRKIRDTRSLTVSAGFSLQADNPKPLLPVWT